MYLSSSYKQLHMLLWPTCYFENILWVNEHSAREIKQTMKSNNKNNNEFASKDKLHPVRKVILSKKVTGKPLGKHSLKPSASEEKIQEIIHSSKDDKNPLSLSAIYHIPCSCGWVYIGVTKCSINMNKNMKGIVSLKNYVLLHDGYKAQFENKQALITMSKYNV